MARSSPPPAHCDKLIIILTGEDTSLKDLVGQLLCGSANPVATEDGLVVTENNAIKVITMPALSGTCQSKPINDCMALAQPGPHLFILTVDAIDSHMEKMEEDINVLHTYLGDDIIGHLVVMVKDMDSYQKLRPLKDKLGFRLATASENIQKQCEEWGSGSVYNYENYMKHSLTQRRKVLEMELKRDLQHVRTPRPTTDGKPASRTAAQPDQSASESSTGKPVKIFNMILMGQTASGKSASAKTILSTLCPFMSTKHLFKSELRGLPVTTKVEAVAVKALGAKLTIVDTPDFFHDQMEDVEAQVEQCRQYCRPDCCVVLLVIQAGRFTDGEREILAKLEEKMGWPIRDNTVLLLTHGEKLPNGDHAAYINGQAALRELVLKCSYRCVVFNNRRKNPQQVLELMTKIPYYREVFPKLTDTISKNSLLFMISSSFQL